MNDEERRAIKGHLARHILDASDEIDGRTGAILVKNRVLNSTRKSDEDGYLLELLSNPAHPDRISGADGPLVAHFNRGNRTEILVIDTTELLLSGDEQTRMVSLKHLQNLITRCKHLKPGRLGSQFEQGRSALASTIDQEWSACAVRLFDFVTNDFFLNIAALRQSVELNFTTGVNQYLQKILNPAIGSLDWIELPIPIPSKEAVALKAALKEIVLQSESFTVACSAYYEKVGTIPLAEPYSLAKLWDLWAGSKEDSLNLWQAVWKWADEVGSPIARYHVVQLLIHHPSLIPDGETERLWKEISQLILPSITETLDKPWSQEWKLRTQLAQYYIRYFECYRPGRDSEALTRFSWWLAERVAMVFAKVPNMVETVRVSHIEPALTKINYGWQAVTPYLNASTLRYATLSNNSIWSLSVICQAGQRLEAIGYRNSKDEGKSRLEQVVGECLSSWFPSALKSDAQPVYAFDDGFAQAAQAVWGVMEPSDKKAALNELITMRSAVTSEAGLLSKLSQINDLNQSEQAIVSIAFRSSAYFGAIPVEETWNIISNPQWNEKTLQYLDASILQFIFDGLNSLQVRGDEVWRANLPHLFANATCTEENDPDRRTNLFLFTILSSITGDTVSAVDRILKGTKRNAFFEDAKFWHDQFSKIMQLSPPWVAARIRPVVVSLSMT